MIITLKKAILHIIAPGIDSSAYSRKEIDISDASVDAYIISHLERLYNNATLRKGTFAENSGFKYHINQYRDRQTDFVEFSTVIAQKLQDGIAQSEVALASDIIVCECIIRERLYIAVIKCDNKSGMSHRIIADSDEVKNEIISYHAILPSATGKLSECAFIDLDDLSLQFKGKVVTVNGERLNLMSEVLLECESELSVSETYSKVKTIAKKVTEEYGADSVQTDALIKQAVKDSVEEEKVEIRKISETVFSDAPAAKAEFEEKLRASNVPETIDRVEYITKKANKKIKILTDTDIEISMPAEFYKDGDNMVVNFGEDGTVSITINNVREIINKS